MQKEADTKLFNLFEKTSQNKVITALTGPKCATVQGRKQQQQIFEKSTFATNYDTESLLTFKSYITQCYKQRNRLLVMKRLPKEIVELQDFMDEFRKSSNQQELKRLLKDQKERKSKILHTNVDVDLLQPWIELEPS